MHGYRVDFPPLAIGLPNDTIKMKSLQEDLTDVSAKNEQLLSVTKKFTRRWTPVMPF